MMRSVGLKCMEPLQWHIDKTSLMIMKSSISAFSTTLSPYRKSLVRRSENDKFHNSSLMTHRKPKKEIPNAGLRRQMNLLNLTEERLKDIIDPSDTNLELDPQNPMPMHQKYVHTEYEKERINKLKKVKKKYFAEEQELNLLTWSAKEQIRYLHHTDPQQWTPEHIAQCFPISPEGVKKLLQHNQPLLNEKAIVKHDTDVARRWRKQGLQGGPISEKVAEEVARKLFHAPTKNPNSLPALPEGRMSLEQSSPKGEFVKLYEQYTGEGVQRQESPGVLNIKEVGIPMDHQHQYVQWKMDEMKTSDGDPSPQVRVRISEDERHKQVMEDVRDSLPHIVSKYQSRSKVLPEVVQQDHLTKEAYLYDPEVGYQHPVGKKTTSPSDRISIPPERLQPPGHEDQAIYRVGNSFYDSDGEFLFSVPSSQE